MFNEGSPKPWGSILKLSNLGWFGGAPILRNPDICQSLWTRSAQTRFPTNNGISSQIWITCTSIKPYNTCHQKKMIHDDTIKFQGAVLVAIGGYTNIVMDSYGAIECEQGSLCPARRLAAGVPAANVLHGQCLCRCKCCKWLMPSLEGVHGEHWGSVLGRKYVHGKWARDARSCIYIYFYRTAMKHV